MSDKYRVLRNELKARDIDTAYLAQRLDVCPSYIYQRMNGSRPWSQSDMYTIMDMAHLPRDQMHVLFPPGGMYAGELHANQPTPADELIKALKKCLKEANVS